MALRLFLMVERLCQVDDVAIVGTLEVPIFLRIVMLLSHD